MTPASQMEAKSGNGRTLLGAAGARLRRRWDVAVVVVIALLLFAPRFSGPIDLRYDAGVYYLLGTSLAKGEGYRIPSEPGSPQALQYPPLLPAFVALHQVVLRTTDPAVVAPWLRTSYIAMFAFFAVAILTLARKFLRPAAAVAATALSLLHVMTFFMSDLLFAELPFALAAVGFALVANKEPLKSRLWPRELAAYALAAASFLLRTAGLALFVAWVFDALIRRRWRLALVRAAMAFVVVALWQGYVERVRTSNEYLHPAYEYQRASYQFYNVSYAENVALTDPFRPELGRASIKKLVGRLATNLCSMPAAVGEALSTKDGYWREALRRFEEAFRRLPPGGSDFIPIIPENIVLVPIYAFGMLVVAGLIAFVRRGNWLIPIIVLGSLGLICTTPWPGQFSRYLTSVAPFLTISGMLGWVSVSSVLRAQDLIGAALRARQLGWFARLLQWGLAGLLALTFAIQVRTAFRVFRVRQNDPPAFASALEGREGRHFFYHDAPWRDWEEAVAWLGANTSPDAIISTTSPHFLYLRTGRRAILPPMESNAAAARRLLEAVPVSHVVVDEMGFLDVSRRYALPAVQDDPATWQVVHSVKGVRIYERTPISR
ncbi:MAG: hypothetical protein M3Q89_03890 [Verrucomicrobiota bacterium]|nr:hypothetical protein [Verrucomicrobiota bacterium]